MSSVVYPILMDLENIISDDLLCLLSSKPSSRLSSLYRPFYKARHVEFLFCKEICALLELSIITIM